VRPEPEEPERRTACAKRGTMSPRPPKWFLWERVFPSDYKCSRENRAGQLASCPARFSRLHQLSGSTFPAAFVVRPVVRLDFPGCICSPMEKRVPTELLRYNVHSPRTHCQLGKDAGLQTPSHAQGTQTQRTNNISASQGKHGTYSSNITYVFAQRPIRLSPSTFMTHGMPLFKKIIMHSEIAQELDTTQTKKDPRDLNGNA
jgi:hypothetical protein